MKSSSVSAAFYSATFLLLAAMLMALYWLLNTSAGLQWSLQQLQQHLPGQLHIEAAEGTLLGPIELKSLRYSDPDIQFRSEQLKLSWKPWHLLSGSLSIEQLAVHQTELQLAERAASENPEPPKLDISLPLNLDLARLEIDHLSFKQGRQQLEWKQISLQLQTQGQQLDIEQLKVQAREYDLNVSGELELNPQLPHHLQLGWSLRLPDNPELSGSGELIGDLRKTHLQQQLSAPLALELSANLFDLLQQPHWQAQLNIPRLDAEQWPLKLPEPLVAALHIKADGDLQKINIKGHADLESPRTGVLQASYSLRWQADTLELQQVLLSQPDSPTQLRLSGQWQADKTPNQTANANSSGLGQASLDLEWQHLRWPLQQAAEWDSERGRAHLSGNPNNFRFEIFSTRPVPQLPESDWQVVGHGTPNQIQFEQLTVDTLDGQITAQGQLNLGEKLSWQAELSATNLDPQSWHADWPGRLNAKLSTQGQGVGTEFSGKMRVQNVSGRLRGYPLNLQSQFDWQLQGDQVQLDIDKLALQSGQSRLNLKGRFGETLDLQYTLKSTDLKQLYPKAEGRIDAKGAIQGSLQQVRINSVIEAEKLVFAQYRLASLSGEINLDPQQLGNSHINLQAHKLLIDQQSIDSVSIKGDSQRLNLDLKAQDYAAQLQLSGKAQAQSWQGKLNQASFKLGPLQNWQLKQATTLAFDEQGFKLAQSCWQNPQDAHFCVDAEGPYTDIRLNTVLSQLALNHWAQQLDPNLSTTTQVNATSQWRYRDSRLTGELDVQLPAAQLSYQLSTDEQQNLAFNAARLQFSLNPDGLDSKLDWKLQQGQHLQAEWQLAGARFPGVNPQTQPIKGKLDARLDDLGLIAVWVPELYRLQGKLAVNAQFAGTLSQPQWQGQLQLQQTRFELPRLGLKLTEVELQAKSQGLQNMTYQLAARSGEGTLKLDGNASVTPGKTWQANMSIKGHQLDLIRVPEAQVQGSPDLQISLQPYRLNISGKVVIPYANLEPREISSATRSSPDVVIVGQEAASTLAPKWQVDSKVTIELGDRVHFYGYGLEGDLKGAVTVQETPGQPSRANGEIRIENGRYRAYGLRLDVQHGRLVFSGGPLLSPGLDIRAVRVVNTITAGVKARGTLNEPVIELFSTPAMSQTDILAYLILGRPLSDASDDEGRMLAKVTLALGITGSDRIARSLRERFGLDEMRVETNDSGDQASLVIGRYLSPKLYVSYGIGIIEAFNTLVLRYQLSDNWQLRGESGEAQGADIIYTIER